jgi:precorrin-2 dehydrogenase/sirohydrochlorin ferrochelatase
MLREALDGFRLLGKVQYPKVWLDEREKARLGETIAKQSVGRAGNK